MVITFHISITLTLHSKTIIIQLTRKRKPIRIYIYFNERRNGYGIEQEKKERENHKAELRTMAREVAEETLRSQQEASSGSSGGAKGTRR